MKLILNIDVPDLKPAIEFYCAALGLTHTRTLDHDTAELTGASSTIYLLQKGGGTQAVQSPPVARHYQRHWTPVHLHVGAAHVSARVALLDVEALPPGATALAQIVTDRPIGAVRGDKLIVDLTTGVSRVESGKNGTGRVQGLFLPGSQPGATAPDAKPDTRSDARSSGNAGTAPAVGLPRPLQLKPPN